jgi:5S rRNA maturation endonuclease (ribonuclease M5)
MAAQVDALREILLPRLDGIRKSGGSYMARCPAHDDSTASLSITEGKEHPVVLNCKAGCQTADILAKIGLTWEDLCNPREQQQQPRGEWTPFGEAIAVYDYVDENSDLLFQVLRTVTKQFPQRVPDRTRKNGYRWSLGDTRRVLYRLPKIIEAVKDGQVIYVVEGEKDVHSLERAGVVATCNPGGTGVGWRDEYSEVLRDAVVIIIADKDKSGQAHARKVMASLKGIAAAVEINEAAGDLKDVSDHLAAGHTLADLEVTCQEDDYKPDLAPDLYEFIAIVDPPSDWVIPGLLERGDRLLWTGFEGLGKALALDTPIPTPKGWTTMGELSAGDEVFGADGCPARVTMATPVMTGHACYRVVFSDGTEIIADADHLWLTETLAAREAHQRYERKPSGPPRKRGTDQRDKRRHFPEVVTTEQIRDTLMARGGYAVNHSVQTCEPLQYAAQELSIAPYTLGAWLGDGTSRNSQITCCDADAELLEHIRADGYEVRSLSGMQYHIGNRPERQRRIAEAQRLMQAGMGMRAAAAHVGVGHEAIGQSARGSGKRATLHDAGSAPLTPYRTVAMQLAQMGLIQNKHIPRTYLEASVAQRLALLQGLMDTDGTVSADGAKGGRGNGMASCEFSVTSEQLARDVHELLTGLGIKVAFRSGPAKLNGRLVGTRYRLSFQTDLPAFRLQRKAERLTPLRTRRAKLRYIKAVEPVESVPVRCIRVDNDDHLFLAGRGCIPTHNSVVVRQLAICAAAGMHPFTRDPISPQRVLFIDCENPDRKSRRHFRNLERIARGSGFPVPEGALRILQRPAGIDLTREEDAAWLLERVTAHRPDLLVCGPFYRLHAKDTNEETAARTVVAALDAARIKVDCALVTEAHAGHGDGVNRSVRPTGSSLLMRWPEFGYGIKPLGEADENGRARHVAVLPWRGPREERHWPRELIWGTHEFDWPWVAADHLNLSPL